jgi:hypothetical protein
MSLIAEIREQMGRESGPVHPKHLAEVLDQDIATVRNTMNQASTKGHGIERLDDGTFSLIPGWKPARGPNAAAEPVAKPVKATRAVKAPKKAAKKKAAKAAPDKPKRKYVRRAQAPAATFGPSGEIARPKVTSIIGDNVPFSRTSLALLVEGVLAGNAEIDLSLRKALREAASHALPF